MKQASSLINRMKQSKQLVDGKKSAIFNPDIDIQIYKPRRGKHIFDVVPYYAGKFDTQVKPGVETYTYYYKSHRIGVNKTEVICPRLYGNPCPQCEELDSMNYDDNPDYFKDYGAKNRGLYNIIVLNSREEKAKGIQVFDQPHFFFEEKILSQACEPSLDGGPDKWIDFADIKNGKTIQLEIAEGGKFDQWLGHKFRDRQYPLDKSLRDKAFKLDEIVIFKTYDEIRELMDSGVSGGSYNGSQVSNQASQPNHNKLNFSEIISAINDQVSDNDELEDLVNFYDLDDIGFPGINFNNDFEVERKRLIQFLESKESKPDHYKTEGGTLHIDAEALKTKLRDVKGFSDLLDLIADCDFESYGFEAIDPDKPFLQEKQRLRKWIKDNVGRNKENQTTTRSNSASDRSGNQTDGNNNSINPARALSEINQCKKIEDLKLLIAENGIDFDVDSSEKFIKEKVRLRNYLKDQIKNEPEKNKTLTVEDIKAMDWNDLTELIDDRFEGLIDYEDYDPDEDIDTLREDIIAIYDDVPF